MKMTLKKFLKLYFNKAIQLFFFGIYGKIKKKNIDFKNII